MVRNYKWNIDLEKGKLIAHETIIEIIKEHNDLIDFNALILLLNQRTKNLNLKNNNQKKTITNFLKSNFKGTLHFMESLDDIFIHKRDNKILISYNDKNELFQEFDEWLFVNTENIES